MTEYALQDVISSPPLALCGGGAMGINLNIGMESDSLGSMCPGNCVWI